MKTTLNSNYRGGFFKTLFWILLLGLVLNPAAFLSAQDIGPTQISAGGIGSNTIAEASTSRNLAVGTDGTIYALYRNPTQGVVLKKSTDRGATFSAGVVITAVDTEAEVATSSNGTVYVVWNDNGILLSKSTDTGATFSAPLTVAAGPILSSTFSTPATIHMATDGAHLYIISQNGDVIYVSHDSGATFETVALGADYVFSDVLVDSASHTVVVQKDNPSVVYQVSTDFGETFSAEIDPSVSIFYSVGGLFSYQGDIYLTSAGQGTSGLRVRVGDTNPSSATFPDSVTAQGRSLSGDRYGNVVTGYSDGADVQFSVSQDGMSTAFPAGTTIAGVTVAEAAINSTNGDVMFIYENAGQVYLNVYQGLLVGYEVELSRSSVVFDDQGVGSTSAAEQVTITNVSGGVLTFDDISASGDFDVTSNCGATLAASAQCTLSITFTPTVLGSRVGNVAISFDETSQPRTIDLAGVGVTPTATPTPTAVPPTATPTPSVAPSATPTVAPTSTATPTPTASVTPSLTPTFQATPTATPLPIPTVGPREIQGYILADGIPLAGVLVDGGDLGTAVTDENGKFVFTNAPVDKEVKLTVRRAGYTFEEEVTATAGSFNVINGALRSSFNPGQCTLTELSENLHLISDFGRQLRDFGINLAKQGEDELNEVPEGQELRISKERLKRHLRQGSRHLRKQFLSLMRAERRMPDVNYQCVNTDGCDAIFNAKQLRRIREALQKSRARVLFITRTLRVSLDDHAFQSERLPRQARRLHKDALDAVATFPRRSLICE